jgi:hypothetical protein
MMIMMKKIKNIKQLQRERKRIQQRERELIGKINSDWRHLKDRLSPSNLFDGPSVKCGEFHGRKENGSLLRSVFAFAATLLIRKLIKRTEQKVEEIFG